MTTPTMNSRAWAMLLALALLWGGSFFFVGVAVREWPPVAIVLARVGLAAAALWVVVAVMALPVRRDGVALRAHLGMGVLNNGIPFLLIVWAQGSLPSGAASILNATTPLWGVAVAHVSGVERASWNRAAGVAVGFLGVAWMVGADLLASPLPAVLAMLAATFSYALAGLWGRRFRALEIPPLVASAGQTTSSTLLLLPALFWVSAPMPGTGTILALVGLALLSTALAYVLYFRLLALAGPVNLLLVTLVIPAFAILLGAAALGERLGTQHLVGMGMIAAGLALIDGRLLRR
ncbi:DMT family transporter [Roseococcus sp.]|uniref:DMT family transporter n=1 Tax=Roseococcus sp. TaxID=2109646 RepID=UPI003BA87AE1